MNWSRVGYLIKKEAMLEWRQRSTFAGMLLYVVGASFIVYYAFQGNITFPVWASIFWIIILFTAIHTLGRSFTKEATEQFYYLKTLVPPSELILAKLIYNGLLLFLFELIIFLEMSLFFGISVSDYPVFMLTLLLGSIGMSNLFTLFSTVTAKTGNLVLLAVLGFPVILPLLLLILRLTGLSDVEMMEDDRWLNMGAVAVLDTITLALALVLFPYLWSE
jgi:heme exporter protein B